MGTSDDTHKQIIELQQEKTRKHLKTIGYTAIEFFEEKDDTGRVFGVRGQVEGKSMGYTIRADNEVFALSHIVRMAQQIEAEYKRRNNLT